MDRISKLIKEYLKKIQSDKRWRSVMLSLAAVVVFGTTYALILPAVTMDEKNATEEAGIFLDDEEEFLIEEGDDEADDEADANKQPADSQDKAAAEDVELIVDETTANAEAEDKNEKVHSLSASTEDLDIRLTFDEEVSLPGGTYLSAEEITEKKEQKLWNTYGKLADKFMKEKGDDGSVLHLLKLTVKSEDGTWVFPSEGATAAVTFRSNQHADTENVYAIGLMENSWDELKETKAVAGKEDKEGYECHLDFYGYDAIAIIATEKAAEVTEAEHETEIKAEEAVEENETQPESDAAVEEKAEAETEIAVETEAAETEITAETEIAEVEAETKAAETETEDKEDETAAAESESETHSEERSEEEPLEAVYEEAEAESEPETEAATEKAAETETKAAETESAFPAFEETAQAGGITVFVSADEGAFPAGTTMAVTAIEDESVLNAALDAVEGRNMRAAAVDITFRDAEGSEIEPALPIRVTMKADVIAEKEEVTVVHVDDDLKTEVVEQAPASELEQAPAENEVVFDADAFSTYALVYTVDFYFGEYEYHLQGGETILLSDLIQKIQLVKNEAGDLLSTEDIADVTFSDETLVSVAKAEEGEDYLLISLKAFDTEETLTIILMDGEKVEVRVTDAAQTTQLNSMVNSISVQGASRNSDGSYKVNAGQEYNVSIKFAESRALQFKLDGSSVLTYQMPSGFLPVTQSGSGVVAGRYGDVTYTYTIDTNGLVTITWPNKSGEAWDHFVSSNTASLELQIAGRFDSNKDEVKFSSSASGTVHVNNEHNLEVNKTGNYDAATNKINYTVTVTSTGYNSNIKVEDIVGGNKVTYKGGSLSATSNRGSFSGTANENGSGFTYTIPSMNDGEVITLNYSADVVDLQGMTKNADGSIGSFDETKNTVKVKGDNTPEKEKTISGKDLNNKISISSLSKNAGNPVQKENGQTITWTINANREMNVSLAGKSITDTNETPELMSYSGDGITVKVYSKDSYGGLQLVETRKVPWAQLNKTESTWSYSVPSEDSNYFYEISYTTDVTTENLTQATKVSNKVEDEYNEDHSEQWVNPNGSGTEPTPGPGDDEGPSLTKTHTAVSVADRTISWDITFDVPQEGYSERCEVTDTYPSTWISGKQYFEPVDTDKITVTGLVDGETYEWDATTYQEKLVIKFYYLNDSGEKTYGLKGTDASRKVTVSVITNLDEDYLKNTTNNITAHTNAAELSADSYVKTGQDTVNVNTSQPSITKKHTQHKGDKEINDYNGMPYVTFFVTLTGINSTTEYTDGKLTFTDTYDAAYFDYDAAVDPSQWLGQGVLRTGDINNPLANLFSNGVTVSKTDTPGKLQITLDKDFIENHKQADDSYYDVYTVVYHLMVKDEETLKALEEAAAKNYGAIYTLNNKIEGDNDFGSASDSVNYEGTTIKKTATSPVFNNDTGRYEVEYTLNINPNAFKIGDEKSLTVTDFWTHQVVDYSSIKATPSLGVTWNLMDDRLVFTVPNETAITITYKASIIGAGDVNYSNTAEINGRKETYSNSQTVSSSSGGSSYNVEMSVLKYEAGDLTKILGGVRFTLFRLKDDVDTKAEDFDVEKLLESSWEKVKDFSTDEKGLIALKDINEDNAEVDLWKDQWYKLVEQSNTSVNGVAYKEAAPVYFIISKDGTVDHGNHIYTDGETIPIPNTPENDLINLKVSKRWEIPEGSDVPEKITVRLWRKNSLYDDDETAELVDKVEISAASDWSHTFSDLPRTDEEYGYQYAYFVSEDAINGFITEYDETNSIGYTSASEINITNKKQVIKLRKEWQNNPLSDSVKVNIYRDGFYERTVTLGESNNWQADLADLPYPAEYTFQEQGSSNYSLVSIVYTDEKGNTVSSLKGTGTVVITNGDHVEPSPVNTSVNVTKKWYDEKGDEISDSNIKDDLTATVELVRYRTAFDGTILHLYTYEKGAIKLVGEVAVPKGIDVTLSTKARNPYNTRLFLAYDQEQIQTAEQSNVSIDADPSKTEHDYAAGTGKLYYVLTKDKNKGGDIYLIPRSYGPEFFEVSVDQEWNPEPSTGTEQSYDPDYAGGATATLDKSNDWTAAFTDLPKYGTGSDGTLYYYTYGIQETAATSGFILDSYEDENGNSKVGDSIEEASLPGENLIVKNKQELIRKDLTVTKQWRNDSDGVIAWVEGTSINVTLHGVFLSKSGEEIKKDWVYIISPSETGYSAKLESKSDTYTPECTIKAVGTDYYITFPELLTDRETISSTRDSGTWRYFVTEEADGYSATYKNGNVTKDNAEDGDTIINKSEKAYALPSTGGPGKLRYIGSGLGLLLMAAWILYIKQKYNLSTASDTMHKEGGGSL